MKNVLVIGATGVAGQKTVRAVRTFFETLREECFILGTYNHNVRDDRDDLSIPGVNAVAQVDVTRPNWISQVELHNASFQGPSQVYDYGFLCFSRGDVGFPAAEATTAQKEKAFASSIQPLLDMEASGLFKTLFAFGSFTKLRIAKLVYGALVDSKEYLDVWANSANSSAGSVERYQIKSAGFVSKSLRGVKVATLRQLSRRQDNPTDPLVKAFGNPDSETLDRLLLERMQAEEYEELSASRLTEGEDLVKAVDFALKNHLEGTLEPITYVVADQVLYLEPST